MSADGNVDAKETDQLIEALKADGNVSTADQEAVLEALASDGKVSKEDVAAIVALVSSNENMSTAERSIVADALVQSVAPGENLTKEQVADAGINLADLPPDTPVEVRTSESGQEIVITAEVAANVELVTDVGALLEAVFTDPGAAVAAIGSIGADMTVEEREEATEMVVATVVATGAAINAATTAATSAATAAATTATRSTGGNPSAPKGSGPSGGPTGGDPRIRRRKT